jgi:hypothetical protein
MLASLLAAALAAGVLHTLAGPDHYLPLIAHARERGFSLRRVAAYTALAGLLHCGSGLVLAWLGAEALAAAGWRTDFAACLFLGLGLLLCLGIARARGAFLLLAFAVGPCEWLVPAALAAVPEHGTAGLLLTGLVFSAATVATMLACVLVGVGALRRVRFSPRALEVSSGVTCVLCAALLWSGL